MKLCANAVMPVVDGDLCRTVGLFVSFLRDHCIFDVKTKLALGLNTARGDLLALVARAIPAEARVFDNFSSREHGMTAAAFLAQSTAKAKGDDSGCEVILTDFLSQEQIVALLSELAEAVPPSGRNVFLILVVYDGVLRGASREVRCRMYLNRPPKGKHRYGWYLYSEFDARSKSDPAARQTLDELTKALGVAWNKLSVMPDLSRVTQDAR